MANLIVQENGSPRTTSAVHGEEITIATPCDCSQVTGVQINGMVFPFYDTLGNSLSSISGLFAKDSLIRVLIDTTNVRAYILNAGTNASLENKIKAAEQNAKTYADTKAASSHKHSTSDITSGTLPVARGGTGNTTVDTTPTSGSTKMVTSGGIYTALAGKAALEHTHDYVPISRTINSKALSSNITLSANDVGAVPTSRTVNGKVLNANITLSASDVGAAASSHTHTKSQITDFPTAMTPTAHNQAASTITAGTLAGKVNANATAAATVGTAQVRDIYAGTDDMTAGTTSLTSGSLYFVYE